MFANMSANTTHRLQPFQPSSELVEKVDQLNQPKGFFPIEQEKTEPTQPTKNG